MFGFLGFSAREDVFARAVKSIRESIYGLNGLSQIKQQVNATNATGFAIAPGVLATAAHFCHIENDLTKPVHQLFEAIRSPDIGKSMETASLLAEDPVRDLALLMINAPRSRAAVKLETSIIQTGTSCGSLGFPLATIIFAQNQRAFNLQERFQSASISARGKTQHSSGRVLDYYETDSLMYPGSSGCPGFLRSARIFGMHVASVYEKVAGTGTTDASKSGSRLAISIWVPAADIRALARAKGITA